MLFALKSTLCLATMATETHKPQVDENYLYLFSDQTFANLNVWPHFVFFQFEIIINVFGSFFGFTWIPMLWVYGHYYSLLFHCGIDFRSDRRQILTYKVGPSTEKVKLMSV